MMLGRGNKQQLRGKKVHWKSGQKKKDHNSDQGIIQKVVSARPPPPNAEIKWYDQTGVSTFNNASSSVPVHAAVGSLNLISQGDQGDNRNGQKIMVRSIDLRGTVEVAKHSGSDFDDLKCETHYFRWILMIDTQANGAFLIWQMYSKKIPLVEINSISTIPSGNW